MQKKFDNIWIGIIAGIIGPILGAIVFYFMFIKHLDFFEYFRYIHKIHMGPQMISLCTLMNLAFFFLFNHTDRIKSARGVLTSTIIIAILALIIKYSS
jgi:glycerol uptake facilitator-like aquaporin